MTDVTEILISPPFEGRWLARNSPARRVPSHGTDLLGERYAIDFVGVDDRGRTAREQDLRTLLAVEPPDRFYSFGRSILSPVDGSVVAAHDGEVDHDARRSPVTLIPYLLTQRARLRQGLGAVAGNHVIIAVGQRPVFIALVHLRRGSLRVSAGDEVTIGQPLAECGNSGNSTQPHVHVQAMDSADLTVARGVRVSFHSFREWERGAGQPLLRREGVPNEGSIIEPVNARP